MEEILIKNFIACIVVIEHTTIESSDLNYSLSYILFIYKNLFGILAKMDILTIVLEMDMLGQSFVWRSEERTLQSIQLSYNIYYYNIYYYHMRERIPFNSGRFLILFPPFPYVILFFFLFLSLYRTFIRRSSLVLR